MYPQIGVSLAWCGTAVLGCGPLWGWFFRLLASCYLLAARFSKIVYHTTFSLWSEFFTLAFCSPQCQAKTAARVIKNPNSHGVEAFMPAVRSK